MQLVTMCSTFFDGKEIPVRLGQLMIIYSYWYFAIVMKNCNCPLAMIHTVNISKLCHIDMLNPI